MQGVHQRTDKNMEVRERKRLEQVVSEVENDIKHLTSNIEIFKARRYEKRKLIKEIKEMLR